MNEDLKRIEDKLDSILDILSGLATKEEFSYLSKMTSKHLAKQDRNIDTIITNNSVSNKILLDVVDSVQNLNDLLNEEKDMIKEGNKDNKSETKSETKAIFTEEAIKRIIANQKKGK